MEILQRNLKHGGDNRLARLFHQEIKPHVQLVLKLLNNGLNNPQTKDCQTLLGRQLCETRDEVLQFKILQGRKVEVTGAMNFIIDLIDSDLAYYEAFVEAVKIFLSKNPNLNIELRKEWW